MPTNNARINVAPGQGAGQSRGLTLGIQAALAASHVPTVITASRSSLNGMKPGDGPHVLRTARIAS